MANKGRNLLPNTYVPVVPYQTLVSILSRLPRQSIIELCNKWPRIVNTQPHLNRRNITQRQLNKIVMFESDKYRKEKTNKKVIIDKMLTEFWPNGLNLLQLSQIDCQLIVDKPQSSSWILSIVKDSMSRDAPISLEPKRFLEMLAKDLCVFFMSHIYVCRHPRLPLIIVRIQLFDLQAASTSKTSNRPHIISNRACFIAFPMDSAHIIHSPGNDMVTDIIMQVIERNIPQKKTNLVKVVSDKKQKPTKSLEAMHVLYGNSRFANSLGAWSAYADSSIDSSPLGGIQDHSLFKKSETINETTTGLKETPLENLNRTANIRFRGSPDGLFKSESLFEEPFSLRESKRRKRSSVEVVNSNDVKEESQYKSLAPIQYAEFEIQEILEDFVHVETNRTNNDEIENNVYEDDDTNENNDNTNEGDKYTSITVKLSGPDVFAGLHELSVKTPDVHEMIVNPYTIPSWLTGEEGRSCGVVNKGIYRSK